MIPDLYLMDIRYWILLHQILSTEHSCVKIGSIVLITYFYLKCSAALWWKTAVGPFLHLFLVLL